MSIWFIKTANVVLDEAALASHVDLSAKRN